MHLYTMTIAVDIMNVVFGQLAFLSNAIFVIISSMKKEKKKMDQLTIAYSFGSAMVGLGFSFECYECLNTDLLHHACDVA
ncbi:putative pre-16S rRNA nuclease [Trichinella spiralis]|uniref:Pre-16S rRNA nuclease n=1 Tax=Trichinella spiralis TaxID=6334 RepID=A0ABR3K9S3_TRISP